MEYPNICLAALISSGLSLFSGFGLGTLLMFVFAVFFPVEIAIALTAIVHYLNNLFKLPLLRGGTPTRPLFSNLAFRRLSRPFLVPNCSYCSLIWNPL
jgi:hypothetical protein